MWEGIGHTRGSPFDKENKLKFLTAEFCLLQTLEDLDAAIRAPHTPAGQTVVFRELPGLQEYFLPPTIPGMAKISLTMLVADQASLPVVVFSDVPVGPSVLGFLACGSSVGGVYFPLKGYRTSARLGYICTVAILNNCKSSLAEYAFV